MLLALFKGYMNICELQKRPTNCLFRLRIIYHYINRITSLHITQNISKTVNRRQWHRRQQQLVGTDVDMTSIHIRIKCGGTPAEQKHRTN